MFGPPLQKMGGSLLLSGRDLNQRHAVALEATGAMIKIQPAEQG